MYMYIYIYIYIHGPFIHIYDYSVLLSVTYIDVFYVFSSTWGDPKLGVGVTFGVGITLGHNFRQELVRYPYESEAAHPPGRSRAAASCDPSSARAGRRGAIQSSSSRASSARGFKLNSANRFMQYIHIYM